MSVFNLFAAFPVISDVDSARMPLTSEGKFLLFLSNFSLLEFGTDFAMVSVRTSEADVGWLLVSTVLLPVTV